MTKTLKYLLEKVSGENRLSTEEKIKVESGISLKDRDSFNITNIDIEPDFELALNRIQRRLLKSSLIVNGLDITLSGDNVQVKKSKNGYMYFLLKGVYVKGVLRKEIFKRLYNKSKISGYIKLGKYEVRKGLLNNKYELYFWFNIKEPELGIEYITDWDAVVASYQRISNDSWSMPELFSLWHNKEEEDEEEPIFDQNGLGWLKIENYLDKLEVIKELVQEIKEYKNNPDIKESLDELRDILEE